MKNPEFQLDTSGVLSDEQWIVKNGISEKFYIHMILNEMLRAIDFTKTAKNKIYINMRRKILGLFVCIETLNRFNMPESMHENIAQDLGLLAFSVGLDIIRYHTIAKNSPLYQELKNKYLSHCDA